MDNDAIVIQGACEPAEVLDMSRDISCSQCGGFIARASKLSLADLLTMPANQVCPVCNAKSVGGERK